MDDYLETQSHGLVCGRGLDFYRQRLFQDSNRVLKDNQGSVELLSWPKDATELDLHVNIDSAASLASCIQNLQTPERHFVYIIRQEYSWDNLCITRGLLFKILSLNEVFPPFLDCLHAFGFRKDDDDEVWEGCHRFCKWDPNCNRGMFDYELAYTYRYIINNGRIQGPRWSVRQTAVYQKTNIETGCSTWILIQPNDSALTRFKAMCIPMSSHLRHPMRPHLVFLNDAQGDWKGFIGHLRLSLQELDEKACFSRVGKEYPGDYSISFSDGQQLQKIRQKLFRSLLVLNGAMAAINSCRCQYSDIERTGPYRHDPSVRLELNDLVASLRYYKSVIRNLINSSAGTAALLKQIHEHHLTTELGSSVKALEASMIILRDIAAATQTGNSDMLRLARRSREDAVRLKTLTRITIFYLPATLAATIFSSNLINSEPLGEPHQPSKLVISQQFWVYVLVTIGVTILTMVVPAVLERRNRRRCL